MFKQTPEGQQWLTSRSAYDTWLKCPRKRYNQYLHNGIGRVPIAKNIALETGSAVHRGLAHILSTCKACQELNGFENAWEVYFGVDKDTKVTRPTKYLWRLMETGVIEGLEEYKNVTSIMVEPNEDDIYTVSEQKALVEALIRAFCYEVLPGWLKRYRILNIETEIAEKIGSIGDVDLIFQSRPDAVLMDTNNDQLMIVSFKTAKQFDERTNKSIQIDIQGLSEPWAFDKYKQDLVSSLEASFDLLGKKSELQKLYSEALNIHQLYSSPIGGVMMVYLLKGRRAEYPEGSGKWSTNNPLIRAWVNRDGMEPEYAYSYYYPNPENKSGKSRLGKGWKLEDMWEEGSLGLATWIDMLHNKTVVTDPDGNKFVQWMVQPYIEDGYQGCCVQPIPIYRDDKQIDIWVRDLIREEGFCKGAYLDYTGIDNRNGLLGDFDIDFPKRRHSCNYPKTCEFYETCWGAVSLDDDMYYQNRKPHHDLEASE